MESSSTQLMWSKLPIWTLLSPVQCFLCLTTLSTLQLGVDNKDAVHTAGAILAVNEDSRTQQVAADTSPAPQPISTAHSKPPPPHALANKRQPQCLQRPRPVSIGALADRFFEDFRLMQNADAKPFMGSLMGSPPSTAPSDLREAMAMGGAGSRRSFA